MITVAMHHPGGRSESFQTAYSIKQKNEAIRYRCVSNDCNMDEEQCEVQRKTAAIFLPLFFTVLLCSLHALFGHKLSVDNFNYCI